jgi:hypothetical protein
MDKGIGLKSYMCSSSNEPQFRYFNDAWNTESPTNDDEGMDDDEAYIDGIDERPTPKKKEQYSDDDFDY